MSAATPNLELPGYRIRRCIGAGGMGEVFEAVEESLDRVVAIKRLRADRVNAEAAAFGTWQARFRREARLLAAVNHPNIATVHSVLEHDGHLYMVMEYVEGRSLREALKPGPLSIEDTIEVCRQIAAGLAAAHDAGVIHRDIKPDNIRISTSGVVKILDFGLARQLGPEADADPGASTFTSEPTTVLGTRVGAFLGTAGYAAPEQVLGEVVDQRADVFGFGCVMYECLCGERAFEGRGKWGAEVVMTESPAWVLLPAQTPSWVRELLQACVARAPTERPGGIREVIARFDAPRPRETTGAPSMASSRSNVLVGEVPHQATSFIGREEELNRLLSLVSTARMVTLVGLGGSGKTRLALRAVTAILGGRGETGGVARDGAYFVRADSLSTPRQLIQSIAKTLRIGVKASGSLLEQVLGQLAERRVLMVFDGCEQWSAAQRSVIGTLLSGCAGLSVMATSRERLEVAGEQVLVVGPLSGAAVKRSATGPGSHTVPGGSGSGVGVEPSDAARLFVVRATEAWPGLEVQESQRPVIEAICRKVGGLPLGIELAAACADVLSLQEIYDRLDRGLDALVVSSRGGSGERSLGAVVGWSYRRLEPGEQSVLRRLCVFAGDFSLPAAERLCDDRPRNPIGSGPCAAPDAADSACADEAPATRVDSAELLGQLSALVRKSLLVRRAAVPGSADPRTRYAMLDPVKEAVLLESRSSAALAHERQCAATRMIAWAIETTESADQALEGQEQGETMERLHSDYASIRGALAAACSPMVTPSALSLVAALEKFWYRARFAQEATEWVEQVFCHRRTLLGDAETTARAMKAAGVVAGMRGEPGTAVGWYERALEQLRGETGLDRELLRARLHNNMGLARTELGDSEGARAAFESALAACARVGDERVRSHALLNLSSLEIEHGDRGRAAELLESAVAAFAQHGDSLREGVAAFNLAELRYRTGDFIGAMSWLVRSLDAARASSDEAGIALSALAAAAIGARVGEREAGRPLLEFALRRCDELKLPPSIFDQEDLRTATMAEESAVDASIDDAVRDQLRACLGSFAKRAIPAL